MNVFYYFILYVWEYFSDEDPFQGFSVRVGKLGMRLFASEYWKCSETACVHADIPTLKFVFAESLIQSDSGQYKNCSLSIVNL